MMIKLGSQQLYVSLLKENKCLKERNVLNFLEITQKY